MAISSFCGNWVSTVSNQIFVSNNLRVAQVPSCFLKADSKGSATSEIGCTGRRPLLAGFSALTTSIFPSIRTLSEEVPNRYKAFVDSIDGYSYFYPSDWRDFDFLGHDSAFKDRLLQLQNVRVSFKPTNKKNIRDLGPMEEVVFDLVRNVFAAPNQKINIFGMEERTIEGKTYWTFEYELETPSFGRTAFATVAIGNGRYYTLIVGANERRWSRFRNRLKVVADSFRIFDI